MNHSALPNYLCQLSKAQPIRALRWGIRLRPLSDKEYSTRGGISGKSSRLTRLSCSNVFNVAVNTFGEISGIALPIALKRVVSFSANTHKINMDHLLEKREIMFRTGQASMQVYFFKFSFSSNLFIFSISYSTVTVFRLGNFLFP